MICLLLAYTILFSQHKAAASSTQFSSGYIVIILYHLFGYNIEVRAFKNLQQVGLAEMITLD